jgi:hypothetical protein
VSSYVFGLNKPESTNGDPGPTSDLKTFGLLQSAFSVNPKDFSSGVWWQRSYSAAPDLALNHPARWDITLPGLAPTVPSNCLPNASTQRLTCAELNQRSPQDPAADDFHNMRGFFISSASHPGEGPQLTTANAGDKLRLQARVYNYSFKKMNPDAKVHVRFYGMEWNSKISCPAGTPRTEKPYCPTPENTTPSFLIGEDVIGGIPPFDSNPDGAPLNWVLANTDFDTTPYAGKDLVFWVVVWSEEADGTLTAELPDHGLFTIPPVLKNLADANWLEAEYSNNVGLYKPVFHVLESNTQLDAQNNSADAQLRVPNKSPVRLLNVQVSENRVGLGHRVEVSAHLRTGDVAVPGLSIVFYDGDPQQGSKAFDIERIPHLRAKDTYQVRVPFRPQSCGAHRVFVTVGAGKPFEVRGSTPAISVGCAPAPVLVPLTKEHCRNNGWRSFGPPAGPFKNEGQCISYVASRRN